MKNLGKLLLVKEMITNGSLPDYPYLKKYKLMAIDWSKQQAFDTNSKANLDVMGGTYMMFITEEIKEAILDILKEILK